jgi:hypothetical protein
MFANMVSSRSRFGCELSRSRRAVLPKELLPARDHGQPGKEPGRPPKKGQAPRDRPPAEPGVPLFFR